MTSRQRVLLVLSVVFSTLLAACGAQGGRTAVPIVNGAEGSRVRDYSSIEHLADYSALVVVAHPTGQLDRVPVADISFPAVTMEVDRVIGGDVAEGSRLRVYSMTSDAETGQTLLLTEGSYLLFLMPFYVEVGTATGDWVPTGGVSGIYYQLSDGDYHRVDPESPRLPKALALNDLKLPQLKSAEYFINSGVEVRPAAR